MRKVLVGLTFSILALAGAIVYNANAPRVEAVYTSQEVSSPRKNRIINGAMRVHQRVAAASASSNHVVDRFIVSYGTAATITGTQDSAVYPTFAQSGQRFTHSLKLATSVATDTVLDATDIINVYQWIEGYNIADVIGDGYNAGFTLSFWVRSSKTGTYGATFGNAGLTRSYTVNFTVDAVDTWERETITVVSPPSGGTWNSTNGQGLFVCFTLRAGANWNSNVNHAWNNTDDRATTSQNTAWAGTIGDTFYLTGVQLERGTSASPFEYRTFAEDLMMCQRYYEKSYDYDTNPGNGAAGLYRHNGVTITGGNDAYCDWVNFKVTKRASPVMSVFSPGIAGSSPNQWMYFAIGSGIWTAVTTTTAVPAQSGVYFTVSKASIATAGQSLIIAGDWTAESEL